MNKFSLGFVYVMQNEAIPGLIKIGMTTNLAEDRAKELFTTGVPQPFNVVFRTLTSNPQALEKEVHQLLKGRRLENRREFFSVSVEDAIDAILSARSVIDGIVHWSPGPVQLHDGDRLILSLRAGQIFFIYAYPNIGAPHAEIIDAWQAHSDGDTLELLCTDKMEYTNGISDNNKYAFQDPVPFLNRTQTAINDNIIGRERLYTGDRLLWVDDTMANIKIISTLFELGCSCQVVARTRQPVNNPFLLLLNDVTRDTFKPEVFLLSKYVQKMGIPRKWTPRNGGEEWVKGGEKEAPPEFWLKQLKKNKKNE